MIGQVAAAGVVLLVLIFLIGLGLLALFSSVPTMAPPANAIRAAADERRRLLDKYERRVSRRALRRRLRPVVYGALAGFGAVVLYAWVVGW